MFSACRLIILYMCKVPTCVCVCISLSVCLLSGLLQVTTAPTNTGGAIPYDLMA